MRFVGYLRVSTERQVEEGGGLAVQRAAIEAWAADGGHEVTAWFSDEGVSGRSGLEHRFGLADALAAVSEVDCDGMVVYRLDRLARDLVLQEQLLADARRSGAVVFSTSAAEAEYLVDDPDDPSRRLIRQVLGAVSEYERAMITLRLKAGRQHKARTGGFAYGSPSLGYRAERGCLVPVPEEQAAVRRAVALRESGMTLTAVAEALGNEGFRTKRGATVWHAETVRRIVERESRLAA